MGFSFELGDFRLGRFGFSFAADTCRKKWLPIFARGKNVYSNQNFEQPVSEGFIHDRIVDGDRRQRDWPTVETGRLQKR
jgi:hypothetical protein